ncbi:MAG TPA: amidohydrolase family protein [Pyrinomonadaceae bacterium]|jgi:imidazolonepropionase-like amidohydrolase|nr:amidohydrolase family protein [Pyrinomonadaceae bacterium]
MNIRYRNARSSKATGIVAVVALCVSLVILLSSVSFVRHASAQQTGGNTGTGAQTASGAQGTFLIRNARIVPVSGPDIENGSVLIRNGRIEAVGAGSINAPAGAQEIDASGLFVYPGMMDAGTNMGLVEIDSVNATIDRAEVGDMNPNAQAIVAVNPHSAHIGVTRFNGITSAVTMPQGGIISGQAAVINLNGTTPREMALTPSAALVIDFPRVAAGGGFAAAQQQQSNINEAVTARDRRVEELRKMLRDAEAYGRAHDAYTRDPRSLPRPDSDIVLASLLPFVRGERPVIFRAARERDIRAAVRFAEEMKLKPIILGGNDAWRAAAFLKERNVPVILTGVLDLPLREDDAYDVHYENAARLQQAGVRFCISTGNSGAEVRDLPYHAGMSAAFGLPRAEALKAVTLYPAQIMNVADRVGSIEAGKLANLVVADGDILDARTNIRYLFIEGRQIPLTSRHTQLYEQFKDRR